MQKKNARRIETVGTQSLTGDFISKYLTVDEIGSTKFLTTILVSRNLFQNPPIYSNWGSGEFRVSEGQIVGVVFFCQEFWVSLGAETFVIAATMTYVVGMLGSTTFNIQHLAILLFDIGGLFVPS